MTADQEIKVHNVNEKQRNYVLVGVRIDENSRELLSWALAKVAEPGDCVIAVHVCPTPERALKSKASLDQYLEVCKELSSAKKVELKGQVLTGSSVQSVLVKEAKSYNAIAIVVGIKNHSGLGSWSSTAKRCLKQLPPSTDVLAIHREKIVFGRSNHLQLPLARKRGSKPSFELPEKFSDKERGFESNESRGGERKKIPCKSTSFSSVDALDQKPGWPLLRRAASATPQVHHGRNVSVVHWVMSLPERFPQQQNPNSEQRLAEKQLKEILKDNSGWFSYDVLKSATSDFSSENLIGKGGCNQVYRGILPDGKAVAVKLLKTSSKEAVKDFVHEVRIISSLNHKHISPLLGVCIHENDLISVYNFSSKGSLEETLHGKRKGKHVLSWEQRFSIAIGLAEALDYLHNRCSKPVIHRDVKSSNVLLSDEFEPQLSDFGLAMWGPTSSHFLIQRDVFGTFGYLAPEYFMYGKVSDKIDVYAFGVVLLELVSGRTPISSETPRGQESLVMWAKPMIESGNAKGMLDPNLCGKFEEAQFRRMLLAATLCLTRAARVRPKIREILRMLRGENDVDQWIKMRKEESEDDQDCYDDEVYPNSSAELHLSLAMLDVDNDDSASSISLERSNNSLSSSSEEEEEELHS